MSTDDTNPNNAYLLVIEEGTRNDGEILFYAISGLFVWTFCTLFAWLLSGYITRNRKRLSSLLIIATIGVIFFSWLDGFIVFVFKTNVFISDARGVMQYQCSESLHFTALCYGLYRYSLYVCYSVLLLIA